MKNKDMQDVLGGLGLSALGVFAAVYAQQYEFGSLNSMGPGFFPIVLGTMLAVLGLVIAVPAFFRTGPSIEFKGKTFGLVLLSLVAFALTLKTLGLILATILCVVLSTLADDETQWNGRLIVALGVGAVTYLVFGLGLKMTLPIWPWSP